MSRKKLGIGIAVVVALAIIGLFFVPHFINSLGGSAGTQDSINMANQQGQNAQAAGLQIQDEVVGTGTEATAGSVVSVHYTGKLTNGQVFDSSIPRGTPFTFTLGAGQVIKGWDLGVAGMKVGGKRILSIPAELAYGARAIQGRDASGNVVDVIPANSTLLFEVELLDVKSGTPQTN